MQQNRTKIIGALVLSFLLAPVCVPGHPGHLHQDESHGVALQATGDLAMRTGGRLVASASQGAETTDVSAGSAVSGQGRFKFRVLYTSAHLPAEARETLKRAHGGFAVDRRPNKGEVYFAIPGAGLVQLSSDLKTAKMLPTPDGMKDVTLHNTTLWFGSQGSPYLAFPALESAKVFTTTQEGDLLHTLEAPTGDHDFGNGTVNQYFKDGGRFIPTDVEQLGGRYYITTGYSQLDFVLTAKLAESGGVSAAWSDLVFGGRGEAAGQLGTGHGITVSPQADRLDVADRPNSEIDRFSPSGEYLGTLRLPEGSFPCDIDYEGQLAIVGCLHGPDRAKGAPIYILQNDEVISTIMPKEELGLENFQHIHNAVLLRTNGKLHIIAQAWNPGDFAVLEQVAQ